MKDVETYYNNPLCFEFFSPFAANRFTLIPSESFSIIYEYITYEDFSMDKENAFIYYNIYNEVCKHFEIQELKILMVNILLNLI